jgi:SagB-type dehydrogenase family enzyme
MKYLKQDWLFNNFKKKSDIIINYHNKNNKPINLNLKKISKFKSYPRFLEIFLSTKEIDNYYIKLLKHRRSRRTFAEDKKISFFEISFLLKYSFGLSNDNKKRFYPSAGALYPLECYLLSLNSELRRGVYHYFPLNHSLEFLWPINKKDNKKIKFLMKFLNFKNPGLILLITSFFKRNAVKYGDLSSYFSLIESGHVGQNIYLLSEMINLGCCAIGLANNSIFEDILDISDENETICYGFVLGKIR